MFGNAVTIRDEATLAVLLATAERHARAAAHAARVATGEIPSSVRLAYQTALVDHDGNAAARVDALVEFWRATRLADLAVLLARD